MKMKDVLKMIDDSKKIETGFMVSFEKRENGMLVRDHFPDKRAGELLLKTEEVAWKLAKDFAEVSNDYVNIYVTDSSFSPVKGYVEKKLNKY